MCGTIRIADLKEIEQVHGNFKRQYEEDAFPLLYREMPIGVFTGFIAFFSDNEPSAG